MTRASHETRQAGQDTDVTQGQYFSLRVSFLPARADCLRRQTDGWQRRRDAYGKVTDYTVFFRSLFLILYSSKAASHD